MEQLWAPWRMSFIKSEKNVGCIFCAKPKENQDEKNFILHKNHSAMVMMNIFPYNYAHLLVSPYEHVNGIDLLPKETLAGLMNTLQASVSILKETLQPEGFNIGMNMGKSAGAGIEDHIHFHIVPRWNGDTNFMPLLAEVKVMPEHLESTYRKLLPQFKARNKK